MAAVTLAITEDIDAGEVTELLVKATAMLGADHAAFASFIKDDEAYESYRFVMACDATWCLAYEEEACYLDDPWLEYARHHADPVLATSVAARTDRERHVVAMARRFGLASAVIVPAQPPIGLTQLGTLCISSEHEGFFSAETLPTIAVAAVPLAQRLHAWQIAQLRCELQKRTRLSADELALLVHQSKGRSSKDIARLTGATPMSVDSKWQRLNAKLGVSSRTLAAQLAAEYRLI